MSVANCVARLTAAAGRKLSDDEVRAIFERVHRAALDIKAGRASAADVTAGKKLAPIAGADDIVRASAERAAAELMHEAQVRERQAALQVVKLESVKTAYGALRRSGLEPLEALRKLYTRDYSGRVNVQSLEQRVAGHKAYFGAKLTDTWKALGNDYLGFFQSRPKLLNLIRELHGEDTGDALAAKGAKAFREVAEEMRKLFNALGGDIGFLDDWGMPQHHSQMRVAQAGKQVWVDFVLPLLNRARYVDDMGALWSEARLRDFLGRAWDTISTDGHGTAEPGAVRGTGKRASRHAEHRQIHYKDAESVITYWERFGERTAVEILHGHIDTMARDIAFIEVLGPNPNLTHQTLRDMALAEATMADPKKTQTLMGQAAKLDTHFDYWAGRVKPTANLTLSKIADAVQQLNVAGKQGGAMLASLFGDKPMFEAVAHLNNQPMFKRWVTELSLLNPANKADRLALQRNGLMLESIRSGLMRWHEHLGTSSFTGKLANGVMRVTGMQAINDIRKGAFGLSLMQSIGNEIAAGKSFARLADSDVRTLRNYGITEADWKVWKLAQLEDYGHGNNTMLTPEALSRVTDDQLRAAHVIGQADGPEAAAAARRDAIVKLLGAINTESEFAVVTPGWNERATFYAGLQRGTASGEIWRSVLQFKSFPWALFQRGMDLIANQDTPLSKAGAGAYLIISTTLAGAMLMQTREVISGKDPRNMAGDDWYKFWGAAFITGGALGIYGDLIYGAGNTRYGSGAVEVLAGPTVGPLLELGVVQPFQAIQASIEGKDSHFLAKQAQDLKGVIPGGNIWYAKAAIDHFVMQHAFEALSPGYLSNMRSRVRKEYGQDYWWGPGEFTPERAPDLSKAIAP